MTQQEIQERNKQIALMLGKKEQLEYWKQWVDIESKLKWHSDWNWLMEAVEFIEKSADWSLECLHIDNKVIFQVMVPLGNINIVLEDKKEAVFIAVSQFAKLYNNKQL
jgi:hypothetical protein